MVLLVNGHGPLLARAPVTTTTPCHFVPSHMRFVNFMAAVLLCCAHNGCCARTQHSMANSTTPAAGQKLMSCLKCISKGLEADSSFTRLWLLYLPLYRRHTSTKGDPSDATHVAESCLSHSKHCYQLWLTAIQLQPAWQQRATLLQRGIVALSQTKAGQYDGLSKEEEEGWAGMRSACVLDLTLRLLLLWTSAEAHDVVASWIQELVKAAGQAVLAAQMTEGKDLPWCMHATYHVQYYSHDSVLLFCTAVLEVLQASWISSRFVCYCSSHVACQC